MRVFKRAGGKYWQAEFYENGVRVQRSTRCTDREAAMQIARRFERDAADPDAAILQSATLSDALTLVLRSRTEMVHANRRSDDWSSTAYWYQMEPHKPLQPLLSVNERVARKEPKEIAKD